MKPCNLFPRLLNRSSLFIEGGGPEIELHSGKQYGAYFEYETDHEREVAVKALAEMVKRGIPETNRDEVYWMWQETFGDTDTCDTVEMFLLMRDQGVKRRNWDCSWIPEYSQDAKKTVGWKYVHEGKK